MGGDVAISCIEEKHCTIPIDIEKCGYSMLIGWYFFVLRCWRFPRRGFAPPRNDTLDGAVQPIDKLNSAQQ